jgi:hypothetical protein
MRGASAPSPTMRGDIGLRETSRMSKALRSGTSRRIHEFHMQQWVGLIQAI